MATKQGPRFKECRRLGVNVCGHPKAMRRAGAPAFAKRQKVSEYGLQLIEKQKIKAYYGILEKQMRRYFEAAKKEPGKTGDNLFALLERRLDNLVYRIGFANSIRLGRQMVTHGHVLVNGKKVDIPSYLVQPGDAVSLKPKSCQNEVYRHNFLNLCRFSLPYIDVDTQHFCGVLTRIPARDEVPVEVDDRLVVELYSRFG